MAVKQCIKCGEDNNQNAISCSVCGSSLQNVEVSAAVNAAEKALYGRIGGWLILFLVVLILSAVRSGLGVTGYLPVIQGDVKTYLTIAGDAYVEKMANRPFLLYDVDALKAEVDKSIEEDAGKVEKIMVFEMLSKALMFIVLVGVLVLFFMKKRIVPMLVIGYLILNVVISIIDNLLTGGIPILQYLYEFKGITPVTNIISAVLPCFVWIPYFLRSERVRYTFVN